MTTTPSTSPTGADTAEGGSPTHVHVPAQVIRRPPGAPRPIPAPRQPVEPAPAGLTGRADEVAGLYAPEPTGRTEPLAGWSLLLGILLPPVGVAVGAVALVRIRRRAANGRGLAVSGIVVGALLTAVMVLVLVLSALVSLGGGSPGPTSGPGGGGEAVSQTCSGSICTVTARGAPVTVNGIGAGGADGVTVLSVGEGSAVVASPEGPMTVPTGTALELGQGTRVVLTQASADTVVLVYGR